ncbi:hypothetical protein AB4Z48_18180 [Cupriavidus sp. 2TAF22]|uniref:hypothetical protein n=1 Tax=unclassified Cupriavidus TaxID=2640874 RepID=UPI003F8F90E8
MDQNTVTYYSNFQTELEPLLDSVKLRIQFTPTPGDDDLYATPWIAIPRELLPALLEDLSKQAGQLQAMANLAPQNPDQPN